VADESLQTSTTYPADERRQKFPAEFPPRAYTASDHLLHVVIETISTFNNQVAIARNQTLTVGACTNEVSTLTAAKMFWNAHRLVDRRDMDECPPLWGEKISRPRKISVCHFSRPESSPRLESPTHSTPSVPLRRSLYKSWFPIWIRRFWFKIFCERCQQSARDSSTHTSNTPWPKKSWSEMLLLNCLENNGPYNFTKKRRICYVNK